MKFNIWFGFIIPWIIGIRILKKDKTLLGIIPFVSVIATLICLWGDYKKYWLVKPKRKAKQYLTTMPYNLGLYPVAGVTMVSLIKKSKKKKLLGYCFFFNHDIW